MLVALQCGCAAQREDNDAPAEKTTDGGACFFVDNVEKAVLFLPIVYGVAT
jgi:hypothetical protein